MENYRTTITTTTASNSGTFSTLCDITKMTICIFLYEGYQSFRWLSNHYVILICVLFLARYFVKINSDSDLISCIACVNSDALALNVTCTCANLLFAIQLRFEINSIICSLETQLHAA